MKGCKAAGAAVKWNEMELTSPTVVSAPPVAQQSVSKHAARGSDLRTRLATCATEGEIGYNSGHTRA